MMKYLTYTWDLVPVLKQYPCFLQDTSYIHWLHLPKQSTKKKQKTLKKDLPPSKSYRIALAYIHRPQGLGKGNWKPALREVVTRLTG